MHFFKLQKMNFFTIFYFLDAPVYQIYMLERFNRVSKSFDLFFFNKFSSFSYNNLQQGLMAKTD